MGDLFLFGVFIVLVLFWSGIFEAIADRISNGGNKK